MTDRELLELAAKVAGMNGEYVDFPGMDLRVGYQGGILAGTSYWNPLEDDGDALRLAVVLNMEVYHADDGGMACYASWPTARGFSYAIERHGVNAVAATRRAIVRAAAAIGEAMP